jgi:hypothetical protein
VPVTGCSKIARRRPLYVPRLRALGCWPLAGPAACHATSSRPLLLLQAARPAAAQGLSTIVQPYSIVRWPPPATTGATALILWYDILPRYVRTQPAADRCAGRNDLSELVE